ncbi:S1C family serine protease [Undibacterium sp. Di26W]|uniref:S1C family serine protease n=1 Tax=Undibacterium sp. Di26W TaxID=3413035 RepID=UPI003BF35F47
MLKFSSTIKLASGIFLLSLLTSQASAMAPDKFYASTAPSVWRVSSQDALGAEFALGSAVVIEPEALITNCHVIAKAKKISIKQENVTLEAKLQYIDVERDLCQITARNLKAPAVALGDSNKLAVGQHIYTIGNPIGLERTLSDGLISSLRKDDKDILRYIQISAPISPGSSGGGLFDEEGRLIGITAAGYAKGQNLNLAIPSNLLRELPARSAAALAKFENSAAAGGGNIKPEARQASAVRTPIPPASGFAHISDVAKLEQFGARKGYEEFLGKGLPRAFALADGGGWFSTNGTTPKDATLPADPHARVVTECEAFHKRHCSLYAVDDIVVYQEKKVTDSNNPVYLKRTPVPAPSSYADISDVKKLDAFGARKGYEEFLNKAFPRAFAVGPQGIWYWASGFDVKSPDFPEPHVRALTLCERKTKQTCALYAVDGDVVFKYVKGIDAYLFTSPVPPATTYADISDVGKLDKFGARKSYEDFLQQSFPRAFAVTEAGGGFSSYGVNPKDPKVSLEPHVRILQECENYYKRRCYLYAVNGVVVYTGKEADDSAKK